MSPKPRKASTVLVMREHLDKLEVLMLYRHPDNKFVPSCYVFPGGSVDPEDDSLDVPSCIVEPDPVQLDSIDMTDDFPLKPLAYWIAGIRETFEETGLLFAYDENGELVSFDKKNTEDYKHYRDELNQGKITFNDILLKENIVPATDQLVYFSRWITPSFSSIRYDTYFFGAVAPPCQEVSHDGHELTHHCWATPAEIIERHNRNDFPMILPTLISLQKIADARTLAEALYCFKNIDAYV